MLKEIKIKICDNGVVTSQLTIPLDRITIFVGPNNSGKSLILREIESYLGTNTDITNSKLLIDFDLNWPKKSQVKKILNVLRTHPHKGFLRIIFLLTASTPKVHYQKPFTL